MSKWIRVNRKHPCSVCGRADWCGYSEDGTVAICMREPSNHPTHNGGYLHRIDDPVERSIPVRREPIREVPPSLESLWRRWSRETTSDQIEEFASSLNVSVDSLDAISCAWNGKAWAFPMKNDLNELIGIRLRGPDGSKWAVTGSRNGLFIPAIEREPETVWIVEGPTDCAAGLTIGLDVIGRPSCSACDEMAIAYLKRIRARRAIIITDNDDPGIRGAEKLRAALPVPSCMYVPPAKDLREFVSLGGTRELIESSVKDLVWNRPRRIAA